MSPSLRRRVIREHIKELHKKVYVPKCAKNEMKRRKWLEWERERRSLQMARMFIHSDDTEWMKDFTEAPRIHCIRCSVQKKV